MNYRHAYHAGNFADVMKHLALVLAIDHFRKKDAPFRIIDAHGGAGLYDLSGTEAGKTGEWRDGIGRFAGIDAPADLRLYLDVVGIDLDEGRYPGSPLIAARLLRPQDRLVANELHPVDCEMLRATLAPFAGAAVTGRDAYETMRASLPPPERRGLVLIDPPFERRDEFDLLARQAAEWQRRFATGVFLLWYPVKAQLPVDALKTAIAAGGWKRAWWAETLRHPRFHTESLAGSGIIMLNTPFQLPERFEALAPLLAGRMGLHAVETGWLSPP